MAGPSGRYLRLPAACVSLLANMGVLYHKTGLKSSEILKNLHDSKFVLRIPIKDIGTGLVLRNDRVAVPLFSKGFCLARETIPKYLRYYRYPISILLIQYQQIAAGSRRAGTGLLVSEDCAKVN